MIMKRTCIAVFGFVVVTGATASAPEAKQIERGMKVSTEQNAPPATQEAIAQTRCSL
jgi:hypothetical protein